MVNGLSLIVATNLALGIVTLSLFGSVLTSVVGELRHRA
jgi:hypothetical protein